jgi:hypothetical protein
MCAESLCVSSLDSNLPIGNHPGFNNQTSSTNQDSHSQHISLIENMKTITWCAE